MSRGVAIFSLKLNTKMVWVAYHNPHELYPRERALVPIVQEDGWASVLVWPDADNLAAMGGF